MRMSNSKTKKPGLGLSDLHPDIISSHILTRLDGRSLAALTCTSSQLRHQSSSPELWSRICHSSWPSTSSTPSLRRIISDFPPNGPLSFFSLCSSSSSSSPLLLINNGHSPSSSFPDTHHNHSKQIDLFISAVDISYRGLSPFLSKTCQTETVTAWFNSAPFRIDLLDPKETVPTPIPCPAVDEDCLGLYADLELSWILIDPLGWRAANVSSVRPVSVHRHWLTGEIQAKFASVVGREVAITVEVTCTTTAPPGDVLAVREVGMEVEGLDGVRLSGRESLEVLKLGLEGGGRKRTTDNHNHNENNKEGRITYDQFMEMRRQMKAIHARRDGTWDLVCVGTGALVTLLAAVASIMSFFCTSS